MDRKNSSGFASSLLLILTLVGLVAIVLGIQNVQTIREVLSSFASSGVSVVTLNGGKLYVGDQLFEVRGVDYNPTSVGSDQLDASAPQYDVPKIAAMGANTIGTYFAGKADWDQWTDLTVGENFYNALYPVAEQYNLKIVVGYFANDHVNWGDMTQVARLSSQYQSMVLKAKDRPSTLMYMIGNELFEKLGSADKVNYAGWVKTMVDWTHANDPNHPVMYADRGDSVGLPYLQQYASNIDVYGVNNYSFTSESSLTSIMNGYASKWPGKAILLHEWGSDSLNASTGSEDESAQTSSIRALAAAIAGSYKNNSSAGLIGGLLFEFTDEWRFVGSVDTQDKDSGWACASCFDGKANEDFWGVARNVASGGASGRQNKASYNSLKDFWATLAVASGTPVPTTTATSSPAPTANSSAPVISGIKTNNKTTSSITILWTTDIGATSQIFYGPSATSLTNLVALDSNLVTSHSLNITNLSPNTKYYYQIHSKSGSGVEAVTPVRNFTTAKR